MSKETPQQVKNTCKKHLSDRHKYYYSRACLEFSSTVYVAVQYNQLPELPKLYSALANLIEKNPPLGLQLFSDGEQDVNAYKFTKNGQTVHPDPPQDVYAAQVTEIDFSKIVLQHRSLDIKDKVAVDMFLNKKFEYGRSDSPLWKIYIMKDNWLVFNFDHTLLDGMSGAIVHKSIISYLNENSDTGSFKDWSIYYPKILSSPDDFEVYSIFGKPNVTPEYIANKFPLNPEILGSSNTYSCGSKYLIQRGKFVDNHAEINIPQDATLKLIQLGKKLGKVSMNTLILSIFAASTKYALVSEEQAVKFFIPVNSRSITEVPPNKVGLIVKGLEVVTPVLKSDLIKSNKLNQETFWDFSSTIQKELSVGIPSREGIEKINMLSLLDNLSFIKSKEGKPAGTTFEVSNLGLQFQEFSNSDTDTDNKSYSIVNAVFNQCIGFSNCFTVSSIATVTSGTNLEIVYPDELKSEVDQVITNFKTYIQALLDI